MGLCTDKSTTYLKGLGYNVVRHPREGISPLGLIGRQGKTTAWLGTIEGMLAPPTPTLPSVEVGLDAADINGQQSSKLDIAVAANVLGSLVGAMGGNLGIETGYTNARTVSFAFEDVTSDRVDPLAIGSYLAAGELDAASPLLREYVLGNGDLLVIAETVKSSRFTAKYERRDGVEAKVEAPVIGELVGGEVDLSFMGASNGTVTYAGARQLVFGFRCLKLGVLDGELNLMLSDAGAVPLALREQATDQDYAILTDASAGLVDLEDSPVAVGP